MNQTPPDPFITVEQRTRRQIDERRRRAVALAVSACSQLKEMGVSAMIIGSLAQGRFGLTSDIDFLITVCPDHLKYRIESIVEDALGGFPFDVVYLDEIQPHRVERFSRGAIDAVRLADLHGE